MSIVKMLIIISLVSSLLFLTTTVCLPVTTQQVVPTPAQSNLPQQLNHLIRFVGMKHGFGQDIETARYELVQFLEWVIQHNITLVSLDENGASWYSRKINSKPGCPDDDINRLMGSIKESPDRFTRDFLLALTPEFLIDPTMVQVEWLGPCAQYGRKRSKIDPDSGLPESELQSLDEFASSTTLRPSLSQMNLLPDPAIATPTTEPSAPTTTTDPPTTTRAPPTPEPAASPTTTTPSIQPLSPFESDTNISSLQDSVFPEGGGLQTFDTGPLFDNSIDAAANGTSTATTTTTTSQPTTTQEAEATTTTMATTTSTNGNDMTDDSSVTTAEPANEPPTVNEVGGIVGSSAPVAPTSSPTSGASTPHYGKYIGLAAAFTISVAYFVCSRAYKRQGMYELQH